MTDRKKLDFRAQEASCRECSTVELCLPQGLSFEEREMLNSIVVRQQPYHPGQHLYRPGDRSTALFAVRSGALKSYCITEDGEEQVLGFTMPGEMCGLDGLSGGSYSSASVVLETASVCEFPYSRLEALCHEMPTLHKQLMNVIGREIISDHNMLMLLGKRTAEERLASFLLSLSMRYHQRGLSATEFNLPMSRQDIGNYLGLAIETVSRLFANLQERKVLEVSRRQIRIRDLEALRMLVEPCSSHHHFNSA